MIGMTVCSGIGAPEVAAPWIDWRYQSEIEKFPSAVLAHRFPNAVNLGDMTKFKEWPDATVDVLVGGTPCQSFSVAGLRKGLDDPRGNLMLTFLAIARRYRPRWIVWENVFGVLSSNGGRDFGTFLGGLGECGYGWAYRVLDAQYVRTPRFPRSVPQRRRRVFVVGYLGDWRRAAAVLFEPEGLQGHPPPRREAGEGSARGAAAGVAIRGREGGGTAELTGDVATAIRASQGGGDKPHVLTPEIAHSLRAQSQLSHRADQDTLVTSLVSKARCSRDYKGARPEADQGAPLVAHALRGEGFDAAVCSVDGCRSAPHAKGMCKPHYARFKRHGDPGAGRVSEGEPMAFLQAAVSVAHDDCILWPYATLATGYGSVSHEGRTVRVHRLVCEKAHGPAPSPELDAAHSCGHRLCINPNHLRWATRLDNMADAIGHGTTTRGEKHWRSRLTENAVRDILARLSAGETHEAIAEMHGVARTTVTDIAKGKNWAWLSGQDGTGRGTPLVPVLLCNACGLQFQDEHGAEIGGLAPYECPQCGEEQRLNAVAYRTTGNDGVYESGDDIAALTTATDPNSHILAFSSKDYGADAAEGVSPTLRAGGHDGSHANAGVPPAIAIQERAISENPNAGPDGAGVRQDGAAYTLEARTVTQAVAFDLNQITSKTNRSQPDPAVHHTLPATAMPPHLATPWAVRRLTPTECEKLQGFPVGWTQIPYRNKPADQCPDGPRYKALGNSWAVNCGEFIFDRMRIVDAMPEASLEAAE